MGKGFVRFEGDPSVSLTANGRLRAAAFGALLPVAPRAPIVRSCPIPAIEIDLALLCMRQVGEVQCRHRLIQPAARTLSSAAFEGCAAILRTKGFAVTP